MPCKVIVCANVLLESACRMAERQKKKGKIELNSCFPPIITFHSENPINFPSQLHQINSLSSSRSVSAVSASLMALGSSTPFSFATLPDDKESSAHPPEL